ncbi:MAG: PucR family transcriptional regulator [Firmicutes bacterium]|nr:PucR family transcriptional regulator [Bacillota bacterium]
MKLTIEDIIKFPMLDKLQLVAGHGGLKKAVSHCGILDYEYDKDVSSKYYDYNYQTDGEFLTLTTFLYAKNDPHLIYDAVKKLVSKKGSGLIIKNIFKLPISDRVKAYADRMDFPIFILNDSHPFFEDIIVEINKAKEALNSVYYMETKLKKLLAVNEEDRHTISSIIRDINPSMQQNFICLRFLHKSGYLMPNEFYQLEQILYQNNLLRPEDSLCFYENGFLVIHSNHKYKVGELSSIMEKGLATIQEYYEDEFYIGISRMHHTKEDLALAVKESSYAAQFHKDSTLPYVEYSTLKTYQAILPFADKKYMQNYALDFLGPLEKYDNEKHSDILLTTVEFVKSGGDLEKTATALSQHKNTIRNRMKKAGEILNLNPFSLGDYESLALAVRIHICSGL